MMNAVSITSAAPIETLGHGVTRQWFHNHRLVKFTIPDFSRESIDSWIEETKATIQECTASALYIVHDTTVPNTIIMPPYMKSRAQELTDVRPDLPVFAAAVLPKTFLKQILGRFLADQKRNSSSLRFFFDEQEAMNWLEEMLAKQG